jgi:hypothetical protein
VVVLLKEWWVGLWLRVGRAGNSVRSRRLGGAARFLSRFDKLPNSGNSTWGGQRFQAQTTPTQYFGCSRKQAGKGTAAVHAVQTALAQQVVGPGESRCAQGHRNSHKARQSWLGRNLISAECTGRGEQSRQPFFSKLTKQVSKLFAFGESWAETESENQDRCFSASSKHTQKAERCKHSRREEMSKYTSYER